MNHFSYFFLSYILQKNVTLLSLDYREKELHYISWDYRENKSHYISILKNNFYHLCMCWRTVDCIIEMKQNWGNSIFRYILIQHYEHMNIEKLTFYRREKGTDNLAT